MTLQEIKDTRPIKLKVTDAAAVMGVTPLFLRYGLQQGRFPFGVAVEMGDWAYYVNTERFIRWMEGGEIN